MDTQPSRQVKEHWWDFFTGVGIIIYVYSGVAFEILKEKVGTLRRRKLTDKSD
jgi:uncharacterized membrane protein YbhN (UPF0104 family)